MNYGDSGLVTNFTATLRRTTIAEGLKKSFKKGRESEQQLAAQALSLVILTLGADSEDLFSEFQPLLLTWLKNYEEGASSVLNEVRSNQASSKGVPLSLIIITHLTRL